MSERWLYRVLRSLGRLPGLEFLDQYREKLIMQEFEIREQIDDVEDLRDDVEDARDAIRGD